MSLCPGVSTRTPLGPSVYSEHFSSLKVQIEQFILLQGGISYMLSRRNTGGVRKRKKTWIRKGVHLACLRAYAASNQIRNSIAPTEADAYNSHGSQEEILYSPGQIALENDAPCN